MKSRFICPRTLFAGVCLAVFSSLAQAEVDHRIVIENAWALPLPSVAVNGASYLTIRNHGQDDAHADSLIGARSPIAGQVEIHNTTRSEGQMKMQKTDRVRIPAQGTVVFEPGAMHIMLKGLTKPLVEGEMFPLTLEFEKAGEVNVMVLPTFYTGTHIRNEGFFGQGGDTASLLRVTTPVLPTVRTLPSGGCCIDE